MLQCTLRRLSKELPTRLQQTNVAELVLISKDLDTLQESSCDARYDTARRLPRVPFVHGYLKNRLDLRSIVLEMSNGLQKTNRPPEWKTK